MAGALTRWLPRTMPAVCAALAPMLLREGTLLGRSVSPLVQLLRPVIPTQIEKVRIFRTIFWATLRYN